MKKFFMILSAAMAAALVASFALAQSSQAPAAHGLSCRIIETLGDSESDDSKQQIYILSTDVIGIDRMFQIREKTRQVPGIELEFQGCADCATQGTTRVPQITAILKDTQTGARSHVFFREFGVGILAIGDRTVSYICSVQ